MKKIIFFIMLSLVSNNLKSKNYQIINPDFEYHYKSWDSTQLFIAVRIDSIISKEGFTELYNFYSPSNKSDDIDSIMRYDTCITPFGASWLGKKVLIYQDGMNGIITRNDDTLWFKTDATVGEEWRFMNTIDSVNVFAKMIRYDILERNNKSDSVKIIHLVTRNNAGAEVVHKLNKMEFLLSKNYGLLKVYRFIDFPEFSERRWYLENFLNDDHKLITFRDVFTFEEGDEFHYEKYQDGYTSYIDTLSYNIHIINNVLSNPEDNILKYETTIYQKCITISAFDHKNLDTFYRKLLIIESYNINDYLYAFPDESIIDEYSGMPYDDYLTSIKIFEPLNLYGSRQVIHNWFSFVKGKKRNDSCYNLPLRDGEVLYNYVDGLGVYYIQVPVFPFHGEGKLLNYYKKKNQEWGTPYKLSEIYPVSIEENTHSNEIKVFPNPCTDNKIYIKIYKENQYPILVKIYSHPGKLIGVFNFQKANSENQILEINLDGLQSGLYFAVFDINVTRQALPFVVVR